jgi:hypothetical protein
MALQALIGLIEFPYRGDDEREVIQALGDPLRGWLGPIEDRERCAAPDLDVIMPASVGGERGPCQPHPHDATIELQRGLHVMGVNGDVIDIGTLKHGVFLRVDASTKQPRRAYTLDYSAI